jgi:outer membrane protein TolC
MSERERVQRLLGATGQDTGWSVRGELPAVPESPTVPGDIEASALTSSLELQEQKQRLIGLARRVGVTRTAGWLPDATFDVHGLRGNSTVAAGQPPPRDFRFGGGVNVGIPLFDRNQGTATALEAEYDAALERYYGMAVDIRSEAREARARQYQEVIVPAQRRVTEQTLLQYNAMQLGIFQLLQARREQLDVQLAYAETLREYWSAMAELDALLAGRRVRPDTEAKTTAMAAQGDSAEGH